MLGAIWAQALNGVIGDGTDMPWHIPEDLRHFKETTMGEPVIMGRRTWESLPAKNRPLPGRENFVLSTRSPGEWSAGATVTNTVPESGWIMGGGEVYAATLDKVSRIEMTLVDVSPAPATPVYAPAVPDDFTLVRETDWMTSSAGAAVAETAGVDKQLRYKFLTYVRPV